MLKRSHHYHRIHIVESMVWPEAKVAYVNAIHLCNMDTNNTGYPISFLAHVNKQANKWENWTNFSISHWRRSRWMNSLCPSNQTETISPTDFDTVINFSDLWFAEKIEKRSIGSTILSIKRIRCYICSYRFSMNERYSDPHGNLADLYAIQFKAAHRCCANLCKLLNSYIIINIDYDCVV